MHSSALTEIKVQESQENTLIVPYDFRFLNELDAKEFSQIQNKYRKTLKELDEEIIHYKAIYYFKYTEYLLACSTNFLYTYFQLKTAQSGVPTFINVFSPGTTVSPLVGKIIGYPSAILDSLSYAFNFSVSKKSAIETVELINFTSHCQPLFLHPRNIVYFTLIESGLLIFNSTAIMTELIYLAEPLNTLPLGARWFFIFFVLYFGNKYMKNYLNPAFYEGVENYFLNKKYPSIFKLIKDKDYCTFLQIMTKGLISTAGIRAFPTYYYIAVASEKTLGWWFPPAFIACLAAIVNMGYQYPRIVKEYLDDRLIVDTTLRDQINKTTVDQLLINVHSKIADHTKEEIYLTLIKAKKHTLKVELKKKYTIKKNLQAICHVSYRGFVGGFFGYTVVSPLLLSWIDSPTFIPVFCTASGSLLFMEMLRRAEQSKIDSTIFRHHLEQKEEEKKQTTSTCAAITSALIAAGNGAATAMSTMGTLSMIPEGNSPLIRSMVALIAVDNTIATVSYNYQGSRETLNGLFSRCRRKSNTTVSNEKKTGCGWLCWRNRKR